MKRHLKVILIISLIAVLFVALFVKFIVLPVGNNNSVLWEKLSFNPPGALLEPWMIAKADSSDVCSTVSVNFKALLADSQYDNSYGAMDDTPESLLFVYLYDDATGLSRLVIMEEIEENSANCLLTVFEPEWIGGEALCANLEQSFSAKILHRVNISWQERNYLVSLMTFVVKENPSLIIDPATWQASTDQGAQRIYGMFFYENDHENSPTIWLQQEDPDSTQVFQRIADRFELESYITLPNEGK